MDLEIKGIWTLTNKSISIPALKLDHKNEKDDLKVTIEDLKEEIDVLK